MFKLAPDGTETQLHAFAGGATDGANPVAGLIMDSAANLYGTTENGGKGGGGIVFKLAPDGTETVLYSFCAQTDCNDGAAPVAGLIMDKKGNLLGTTPYGGASAGGTVFKVVPKGRETVLYSFAIGSDGNAPLAGLIKDKAGNLYGTTYEGGDTSCYNGYGCGTVFKLTPDGTETVLYAFQGGSDGAVPQASLIMDEAGNLYGTTVRGGNISDCDRYGCGTVFKLAPDGTETALHAFAGGPNDGANPVGDLIADKKGNLYGTTAEGGRAGGDGAGIAFKLVPDGTETVLYSFCAQTDCTDGGNPLAGLIKDKAGNLYGTGQLGGNSSNCDGHNCGVVFEITK